MRKRILAVCDLEALYACNFMQYVGSKKSLPFEVHAFTSVDKLIEACGKMTIDILLISDKAVDERISELDIGQIMILSEGIRDPKLDVYPSIYKYQSSDSVIREVMAAYGEHHNEQPFPEVAKKPMEIYGVYSPLGRVLKTSFALTLGQVLARERAVLYVNLEDYAGFEQLFGKVYETGLSDLLYFVKQRQPGICRKMTSMVETVNNLDYIPPVLSPLDIRSASQKDWEYLLDEIDRGSPYEALVLDMGNGVEDLYQMLDLCDIIYMPVLSDSISNAKIQQFENLLRLWGSDDILKRIQKIKPPFHNQFGEGSQYVERLLWSRLGDYVRGLVKKESHE